MSIPPIFPKSLPNLADQTRFFVEDSCDEAEELSQLEKEHQAWIDSITQFNSDKTPIGKTTSETVDDDEDEDEDDEDDNEDDEESDTHDEEEEDGIEVVAQIHH